jgi:hypothetical protein
MGGVSHGRLRTALTLAIFGLVVTHATSVAEAPAPLSVVAGGGAAGGDALMLPNGDILNVRNIQGGTDTGTPGDLNLDIGAGSTQNPGDLVLNYDVGRRTLLYDGQKHLVASFGPDGITFYKTPKYEGGAHEASKKGCGWWRWRRYCRTRRVLSRPSGR